MSKPTVYLAGPISGLTFGESTDWREDAIVRLAKHGIVGLSPMRAKDFLRDAGRLEGSYDHVLATSSAITTRDRRDCMRSDLILMNLVGASRISVGTMIEVGWADAARNPIVLAMDAGNAHEHPMIEGTVGFRTFNLEDALDTVIAILAPLGEAARG